MERWREGLHIYIIVESNIALIGGVVFNPIFDNLLSIFSLAKRTQAAPEKA